MEKFENSIRENKPSTTRRRTPKNMKLLAFIKECERQLIPGKFKSPRDWSLSAGVHHHAVATIKTTGKSTPEMIIALCSVAEISVIEGLIALGTLEEADLEEYIKGVDFQTSSEERDLIKVFRQLPHQSQLDAIQATEALLRTYSEAKSQVESELRSQQAK